MDTDMSAVADAFVSAAHTGDREPIQMPATANAAAFRRQVSFGDIIRSALDGYDASWPNFEESAIRPSLGLSSSFRRKDKGLSDSASALGILSQIFCGRPVSSFLP